MSLPSDVQLELLSRGDLIALVKELISAVHLLQARVAELEAEVAQYREPPANSRNSSQPPSSDQKANLPPRRGKRVGARPGHQRRIRQLVEDPDRVLDAPVRQCTQCRADLREVAPRAVVRRQVTELPIIRPVVIETRQHEVVCPACQSVERGLLPEGLGAGRVFGPRLEATVVYLKQQQHLSYERVTQVMDDLCGVELSEGGVACILERAGEAAQPPAAQIGQQVQQSEVIGSDETSARVQGRNSLAVGLSQPSRSLSTDPPEPERRSDPGVHGRGAGRVLGL
jgi:transposase